MPRTCEENLALRAWASQPRHYKRTPLAPLAELEKLMQHPRLLPIFRKGAAEAIASGDALTIATELSLVRLQVQCRELNDQRVKDILPSLHQWLKVA